MPLLSSGIGGRIGASRVRRLYLGPTLVAGRVNVALNPVAAIATGWGYTAGTGEAGVSSGVSGALDGPLPSVTSYRRRVITTPKTSGVTGANYGTLNGAPLVGVAGDKVTGSLYVRSSVAATLSAFRVQVRTGTTDAGQTNTATVVLPANTWVRLSATVTATGAFDNAYLFAVCQTATIQPASTFDFTAALIERGSVLRPYRDANSPGWGADGAANASTSSGWN